MKEIVLSVHGLVDFLLRRGSIDNRIYNNASMAEGPALNIKGLISTLSPNTFLKSPFPIPITACAWFMFGKYPILNTFFSSVWGYECCIKGKRISVPAIMYIIILLLDLNLLSTFSIVKTRYKNALK